jgi:hypothetical protein
MSEEEDKARGAADVFSRQRRRAGLALAGGGTVAFVVGIVIGSRLLRARALAVLAGGGLYASRKVDARSRGSTPPRARSARARGPRPRRQGAGADGHGQDD